VIDGAHAWINAHVEPIGEIETASVEAWATVLRVPVAGGAVWFKTCAPLQAFEPRLSAVLFSRWPDVVAEVIAHDEERSWLLLADAGTAIGAKGNPPEAWLAVLPRYADLQRGETAHADDHLAHGVPDLRLAALPERYDDFLRHELPLADGDRRRLRAFAPQLAELCDELAAAGIPESIQHDDLHMANVYERDGRLRVLDWGDSSISHPFASLFETFRFLEGVNGLRLDDPWFRRLRDAYLEPWGSGLVDVFELAMRVGTFAHAIAWLRQRNHLPAEAAASFDVWFPEILLRAVARTSG
jgi:hypothetical protein